MEKFLDVVDTHNINLLSCFLLFWPISGDEQVHFHQIGSCSKNKDSSILRLECKPGNRYAFSHTSGGRKIFCQERVVRECVLHVIETQFTIVDFFNDDVSCPPSILRVYDGTSKVSGVALRIHIIPKKQLPNYEWLTNKLFYPELAPP